VHGWAAGPPRKRFIDKSVARSVDGWKGYIGGNDGPGAPCKEVVEIG